VHVLVCWENIIFVVAVVVAAQLHNAVKHFRKPVMTSNDSLIPYRQPVVDI